MSLELLVLGVCDNIIMKKILYIIVGGLLVGGIAYAQETPLQFFNQTSSSPLVRVIQQIEAQLTALTSRVTALENQNQVAGASAIVGSVASPVSPSGTTYYDAGLKKFVCWKSNYGHLIYTVGQCN